MDASRAEAAVASRILQRSLEDRLSTPAVYGRGECGCSCEHLLLELREAPDVADVAAAKR